MYSPLDQILTDEELPKLNDLLMKISELIDLQLIANKKGSIIFTEYLKYLYFQSCFIMYLSNKTSLILLPDITKIKK